MENMNNPNPSSGGPSTRSTSGDKAACKRQWEIAHCVKIKDIFMGVGGHRMGNMSNSDSLPDNEMLTQSFDHNFNSSSCGPSTCSTLGDKAERKKKKRDMELKLNTLNEKCGSLKGEVSLWKREAERLEVEKKTLEQRNVKLETKIETLKDDHLKQIEKLKEDVHHAEVNCVKQEGLVERLKQEIVHLEVLIENEKLKNGSALSKSSSYYY